VSQITGINSFIEDNVYNRKLTGRKRHSCIFVPVMRSDFIKNIIKQVVCWILLLQIINLSIDPRDLKSANYSPITAKEDFSTDEIESVYELIAEGVFDKEVPASNEDEIDTFPPSFELYFFTATSFRLPAINSPLEHFAHSYNNFPIVHQEPLFQPPQFA